jgi:hypothetical protein
MELNATLFVQAAHFLCAYVIVDRVLLRPAVARIQADERKYALVERDIGESQERVAARVRYNEQDWHILQKRLRAECPDINIGKHREIALEIEAGVQLKPIEARIQVIAVEQQKALCVAFKAQHAAFLNSRNGEIHD